MTEVEKINSGRGILQDLAVLERQLVNNSEALQELLKTIMEPNSPAGRSLASPSE